MIELVIRAAALDAVYLLVLNSAAPGDIATGGVLGLAVAAILRDGDRREARISPWERLRATVALVARMAAATAVGSWHVARYVLGKQEQPGPVEIPREGRSRANLALWAVVTSEAPDEIVIAADEQADELRVHLIDASDPDAVRERHHRSYRRLQRKVVP